VPAKRDADILQLHAASYPLSARALETADLDTAASSTQSTIRSWLE
jgi:hypothetical protein